MELSTIATEKRNENTLHIDELETLEMIRLINTEDKKVAYAVEKEVDNIAAAVDVIAEKLRNGGRLIYAGCGTSGRLGVLDAVECPPTYSTSPEMVMGILAGGYQAMFRAVEGAEDDFGLRRRPEESILYGKGCISRNSGFRQNPLCDRRHEICENIGCSSTGSDLL